MLGKAKIDPKDYTGPEIKQYCFLATDDVTWDVYVSLKTLENCVKLPGKFYHRNYEMLLGEVALSLWFKGIWKLFFMVQLFEPLTKTHPYILVLESGEPFGLNYYLLSAAELRRIKHLQKTQCSLDEVRILFDDVCERFPQLTPRLSSTAAIVHNPSFENGIVKVLKNREVELTQQEKTSLMMMMA